MSIKDLLSVFQRVDVSVKVSERLDPPPNTAMELAQALGVPPSSVAKVVVLQVGKGLVMAVLPADRMVKFKRLQVLLLQKLSYRYVGSVRLVDERTELARLFPRYDVGAMPPLKVGTRFPLVVDNSMFESDTIHFKAGVNNRALSLSTSAWKQVADTTVEGDFSVKATHTPMVIKRARRIWRELKRALG